MGRELIANAERDWRTWFSVGVGTGEKLDEEVEEALDQERDEALEPPCKVLIHNDSVTPYDFVVHILHSIFQIAPLAAELITYSAHVTGVALVTVLPCPEAEKKVGKAHFAAGLEGYPLRFTVEPEES